MRVRAIRVDLHRRPVKDFVARIGVVERPSRSSRVQRRLTVIVWFAVIFLATVWLAIVVLAVIVLVIIVLAIVVMDVVIAVARYFELADITMLANIIVVANIIILVDVIVAAVIVAAVIAILYVIVLGTSELRFSSALFIIGR